MFYHCPSDPLSDKKEGRKKGKVKHFGSLYSNIIYLITFCIINTHCVLLQLENIFDYVKWDISCCVKEITKVSRTFKDFLEGTSPSPPSPAD